MSLKPHFSTQRGFIAALGFGGVSLYALWAAYGAAPSPLSLLGLGHVHGDGDKGGHGGGHGGPAGGPTTDEFRRMTAEFVERYLLPDGVVHPRPVPAAHDTMMPPGLSGAMDHSAHDGTGGMAHTASAAKAAHGQDAHAGHGTVPADAGQHTGKQDDGIRDVYLLAQKWSYEPAHLRVDLGVPHRFRMMAVDVSHGASIQFGRGGRMIRLRPNVLTEQEITFTRPGSYLLYCTLYCGPGHDTMQARIEVVEPAKSKS
jgi:hypothetical protein